MNKDVIYIDVDDDVTAIIGKIKSAKEKVVAIVPPKRAGALQSAVNLRLLERMAKNDKKQLVLITNNHALLGLAAAAQIPVAKNLQSKPELAEVPALIVDDGDDIIDGSELPVGDHADSVKVKDGTRSATEPRGMRSDAIEETDLEIDGAEIAAAQAGASSTRAASKASKKSKSKIPNFDSFRKKLFLGIGGGVALVALLIWMFAFAPAATVIITASTTPQAVSSVVRLGGEEATNFKEGVVSSLVQLEKKDETIEFEATGRKDVGEKATGTLRISKAVQNPYGVPAGTRFTATNGKVFVTQKAVTIPTFSFCPFPTVCAGSVTVDVTAAASGTDSNGITGSAQGPDGISGTFQGATSGGTTKMARVVSAEDIERARGELIGRSTEEQKKALIEKFKGDEVIIDSSFVVERGDLVSTPAVDQEAGDGKATLTVPTTYSIHAVAKNELDKYLKASLESNIDKDAQKIYSTGVNDATLSNFRKDDDALLATLNSNGRVGPTINENEIKEQVKGKRYGDVQQSLKALEGIKEVDTKFSFFWVRTVPNNTDKISIEFKVEDE